MDQDLLYFMDNIFKTAKGPSFNSKVKRGFKLMAVAITDSKCRGWICQTESYMLLQVDERFSTFMILNIQNRGLSFIS